MSQSEVVDTGRQTIFVDDGGRRDGGDDLFPVLFVHSLAGNARQWSAQLTHLRKTRRALAIELRGHGRSVPPEDGDHTVNAMAQDIQVLIEELGIKRFVLVGHSMGGSIAVAYAGAHPKHVAGLLLVDPSGDSTQMPAAEVEQYLGALQSEAYTHVIEGYWQQNLAGSLPKVQEQVMADLRDTPAETVTGALASLFAYDPLPSLSRYPGPKLSVITPLNDNPVALHALVPELPHQRITGTGHWLHMDKPEEFNQILDAFLAQVDSEQAERAVNVR